MKYSLVIARLRQRCPVFGNRVAGAAEFKPLPETANLAVPAAYVLPLDDQAGSVAAMNGYEQTIRDGFAVVVCLSNRTDERGQAAADELDTIRATLWKALLGWEPDDDHGWVEYEGGEVVHMDRARLYYQFDFAAEMAITVDMTGQGADLDGLPTFTGLQLRVDCIDPVDPNLGPSGPDGRPEADGVFPFPT